MYRSEYNVLTETQYNAIIGGNKHNILCEPEVMVAVMKAERKRIEGIHQQDIWLASNGKWKVHYYNVEGKRKIMEAKERDTLLDKLVAMYNDKTQRITVRQVFDNWIESKIAFEEIEPSSCRKYIKEFERTFERYGIADKPISTITKDKLEDFIKMMLVGEKLTNVGYSNFKIVLRGIWRLAKKEGYITDSIEDLLSEISIGKKLIKEKVLTIEKEVFFDDEYILTTDYLRSNPSVYNDAILLDFLTGVRMGELVTLKKSDLIERNRVKKLHIQRTEAYGTSGQYISESPKTDGGDREVTLLDEATSIIERHINNPLTKDSEWLFVKEKNSKRITGREMREEFYTRCKELGLPHKRFHAIRKTRATQMIDAKIDDVIICKELGHKNIKTTKDFYYLMHKREPDVVEQLKRLERYNG